MIGGKKARATTLLLTDDELTALAQQEALARALQTLGRTLYAEEETNPYVMTETVLTALASIRTWLETSTVQTSMHGIHRERLEEWEDELLEGSAYLARLAEIVRDELHLPLRERNRRRRELS